MYTQQTPNVKAETQPWHRKETSSSGSSQCLEHTQETSVQSADSCLCRRVRHEKWCVGSHSCKHYIRSNQTGMRAPLCCTGGTQFTVHGNSVNASLPVSEQFPSHKRGSSGLSIRLIAFRIIGTGTQ